MTPSLVLQRKALNKSSNKQKILVIYQSSSNQQHFDELLTRYKIDFEKIVYSQPPQQQIEDISKRHNPDLVLGITDSASAFASRLSNYLGLKHTSLKAILTMQHKGLFAKLIAKRYLEHILLTHYVWVNKPLLPKEFKYPLFIRPVQSNMSESAFILNTRQELISTLQKRVSHSRSIKRLWQGQLLLSAGLNLPSHFDVKNYIIQPYLKADQYTLDGFIASRKLSILGITRSVFTKNQRSFDRFEFPATITPGIKKQLEKLINYIITESGLDNTAFNLEFFVTKEKQVIVIELNTRISAQFIPLFSQRFTQHPLDMNIQAAQGIQPNLTTKKSPQFATCFILRRKRNCLALNMPTKKELIDILKLKNVVQVVLFAKANTKLSDYRQDEYSYRYASIVIKGSSEFEIQKQFKIAKEKLLKLIHLKIC